MLSTCNDKFLCTSFDTSTWHRSKSSLDWNLYKKSSCSTQSAANYFIANHRIKSRYLSMITLCAHATMHANDLNSCADRKYENHNVYRLHALVILCIHRPLCHRPNSSLARKMVPIGKVHRHFYWSPSSGFPHNLHLGAVRATVHTTSPDLS